MKRDIEDRARQLGIHVSTWSPGDGVTRYRFFRGTADYFGDYAIYTALGAKEARVFLAGFAAGSAGSARES